MADVICPQCGGRYHETTDKFRQGVVTTGDMLTLKKSYRDNGWASFYEDVSVSFGGIECPECGGQYSTDGLVRIDLEQYENEMREKLMATQYAEVEEKKRPGRPRKQ